MRAFAAFIVVYTHIFSNKIAAHWSTFPDFGLWGVDIFFVISGFIMMCSVEEKLPSATRFLSNRIRRVVPMYWIALSIWILGRIIVPDHLNNADVTALTIVFSYLFIPCYHLVFTDHIWPILVPGWTLQFELFYYTLISVSLLVVSPKVALWLVIGALIILSILGFVLEPHDAIVKTYTSPLLLEFAGGMLLAKYRRFLASITLETSVVVLASSVISAAIGHGGIQVESVRLVVSGIPAVLSVVSVVSLEPVLARRPSSTLLAIGNSSYSLYLLHPIVTSAIAVVWVKGGLPTGDRPGAIAFIPLALLASVVASLICFRFVECKIVFALRARTRRSLAVGLDLTALGAKR